MINLKSKYEHSRPFVKVLQWMGAVFLLTFIAAILMALIQTLGGVGESNVNYLKAVQALQTVSVFLLPSFVVAYLWSARPLHYLHLQKPASPSSLWGLVPLSMLIAAPGINLLAYLNGQMTLPAFLQPLEDLMKEMEQRAETLTLQFLQVRSVGALFVNLLVMALLPALGEELTFRGLLLNALSPKSDTSDAARLTPSSHIAVWGVAILFSAVHFQFYGFLPRMLIGAYLGYLLVWTGSLWVPVLAHFTNNAFAVIASFIAFRYDMDTTQIESLGTDDTLWLGILSLFLTLILILFISKRSTTLNTKL